MKVLIKPSRLEGTVNAPPSKSMSHRFLICAGLSEGESEIDNIAYSQDILATLDCLKALGAEIRTDGSTVKIKGVNPAFSSGATFMCRESGSTLRFFVPLAMLSKEKSLFKGCGRLMERPMEIYEELAGEKNLYYLKDENGIQVSGVLDGGEFSLRGDISSQFVTGLLFALPFCKNNSTVKLTGKSESLAYIDMTVEAMRRFGVEVEKRESNVFYVKGSQMYKPQKLTVEGDYSNAAFLEALNYVGGNVKVTGLDGNSLQGDRVYKEYFELLKKGTPKLDVSACPDLAPILMTLAAAFNGAVLTGTRRLKIKESDRGEVMKLELSKFGAQIENNENEIIIKNVQLHSPDEVLCGHNDHRVVMSLAVLSCLYGGEIEGCEAVNKSYPDFFETVKNLGMGVSEFGN